ncbi:MAG: hypothetical protein QM535_01035 [Limnohabitans sp.]|nr:hypothetical protein [Limnohabitans sp.]
MSKIDRVGITPIRALGLNSHLEIDDFKTISIKYVSSTIDEKNINLSFIVSQTNLKNFLAKIFVEEMNFTNETAINQKIKLQNVRDQKVIVSFDKNKEFDKYFWQDKPVFQAVITCDGLSAETDEFEMKFENDKKINSNEPLCKKNKWTAEDLKFIVTQLRKMDGKLFQSQYDDQNNPIYKDKEGKLHFKINRTDAQRLNYKKYQIETSFYDRNDDVDKKPLKDRLFFYDSDKNDDSVNYNLDSKYANYEAFAKQLNQVFDDYNIKKLIQKIHFLAQIYVETNRFRTTFENDPKNTYSGGEFYRGRGMKQITHDYNYLNYYDEKDGKGKNLFKLYMNNREANKDTKGKIISYESVVNFNKRTENKYISIDEMKKFNEFVLQISTSIYWACDSAGWYWNKSKLNDFANDDENSIIVVSAKVNNPSASDKPTGKGINGLTERKLYFEFLKKIFDYENCK